MTAPDHRAYLVEGDLRTPEDVLAWLDEYRNSRQCIVRRHPENVIDDAAFALEARLDRERRQACRRGALEEWRLAASYVRIARTTTTGNMWWALGGTLYELVHSFLAFRAAARQP